MQGQGRKEWQNGNEHIGEGVEQPMSHLPMSKSPSLLTLTP